MNDVMIMKDAVVTNDRNMYGIEDYAMSLSGMLRQVQLVQQVQKDIMVQDEHYGKIPGTKKNTLFKSGAEKLCMVFRLSPGYDFLNTIREPNFIAYTVKCTLTHISTGQIIATGIGACNSREEKYRYTHKDEPTGKPVPREYWNERNAGNNQKAQQILGGKGFRTIKSEAGQWVISKSEKIENDNAFNLDNTITKMACKRALVAATLNATAASDIFTQDLDDIEVKVEAEEAKKSINIASISQENIKLEKIKSENPEMYRKMLINFGSEPVTLQDKRIAITWIESNIK